MLQTRRVGDLQVSVLGLGTVKFGRHQGVHYPTAFTLPSDHDLQILLDKAAQLGINLLDTAPAYGSSEERLGVLLQGKRDQWIISTKVGEIFSEGKSTFDFSAKAIRDSLEQSLRRLKTDYVDIVFVHSNGDDERIIQHDQVFITLESLKAAGKIRAYGMSTKTIAGGLLTIDLADIAMVTFNPTYTDERRVIAHAHQRGKGIFIKKALASGHLQKFGSSHPIETAMRFIFSEPGVTSVIVGTIHPDHLQENVEGVGGILE